MLAGVAALLYYTNPAGAPQQLTAEVSGLVEGYSVDTIQQLIVQACTGCNFPAQVALGICSEESGFNPNATNFNPPTKANPNGSTDWGLFQINDSVWQTQGLDPSQVGLDPQTNINVGVGLLCSYYSKYNGNLQLVMQAYAIGPGTLAQNYQLSPTQQAVLNNVIPKWTGYTPPSGLVSA